MRIPEKLKLNRFKAVRIPSNREYFGRFGNAIVPESCYSGDDPMPFEQRKMDTLAMMDEFDRVRQNENSES